MTKVNCLSLYLNTAPMLKMAREEDSGWLPVVASPDLSGRSNLVEGQQDCHALGISEVILVNKQCIISAG
jgi:hypothetical protein